MIILDINGNLLDEKDFDPEVGKLTPKEVEVEHIYIITQTRKTHLEVLREYPNGGKDVHEVVDQEEEGYWETRYVDGGVCEHYDIDIPEGVEHEPYVETWMYHLYEDYTDEELAEIEQRRIEEEERAKQAAMREAMLSMLPENLSDIDAAICELYEMLIG